MSEHPHHAVERLKQALAFYEAQAYGGPTTAIVSTKDLRLAVEALTAQQTATAVSREEIARVISPEAFQYWDEAVERVLGRGGTQEEAEAFAKWCDEGRLPERRKSWACERASAVLSLLSGGEGLGSRAVLCGTHQAEQDFPVELNEWRDLLSYVYWNDGHGGGRVELADDEYVTVQLQWGDERRFQATDRFPLGFLRLLAKPTTPEPSSTGRRENQNSLPPSQEEGE